MGALLARRHGWAPTLCLPLAHPPQPPIFEKFQITRGSPTSCSRNCLILTDIATLYRAQIPILSPWAVFGAQGYRGIPSQAEANAGVRFRKIFLEFFKITEASRCVATKTYCESIFSVGSYRFLHGSYLYTPSPTSCILLNINNLPLFVQKCSQVFYKRVPCVANYFDTYRFHKYRDLPYIPYTKLLQLPEYQCVARCMVNLLTLHFFGLHEKGLYIRLRKS